MKHAFFITFVLGVHEFYAGNINHNLERTDYLYI
jgi:hypothetical protein